MDNAKPGHSVEFQGLKKAAHLNGKRGHLVKFNKKEQRWAVRIDDDDQQVVNAKPDNLKRITPMGAQELVNSTTAESAMLRQILEETRSEERHELPQMTTRSSHGDAPSLHKSVMDAFYDRKKGGVVVFCGTKYMLAVEFFGPFGNRGAECEMVYVDRDRKAQAVVQDRRCTSAKELGRNFLLGETTEYVEASNEGAFFSLLSRYQRSARSKQGLIDVKSGLKLYETVIA